MILQPGTVVGVDGDAVEVACDDTAACERCARGEGCGGGLFGALLGDRLHRVRVVVTGPLPAAGSRVRVGLSESAVLRAAALAYLPPLTGLMLMGTVAQAAGLPEPAVALVAAVGLGLGVVSARLTAWAARSDLRLHPVLVGTCTAEEGRPAP